MSNSRPVRMVASSIAITDRWFSGSKSRRVSISSPDHSARTGDGVNAAKSLHRIEESVVRRELEAAGFRFVAEGRFLRNPGDPRSEPVAKPKVPNDEFVLKYRKP